VAKKRASIAALASTALAATRAIATELWHFSEARPEAFEKLRMERIAWLRQGIVAPRFVLPNMNQSRPPEISEVPRCRRLRHTENGDQVADAQLSVLQQVKDPEPGAVRERAEQPVNRQTRRLQHAPVSVEGQVPDGNPALHGLWRDRSTNRSLTNRQSPRHTIVTSGE
jgi:hypothetical protein